MTAQPMTVLETRLVKVCNYAVKGMITRGEFVTDIFDLIDIARMTEMGATWDALEAAFDAHPYSRHADAVASGAALFNRVRGLVGQYAYAGQDAPVECGEVTCPACQFLQTFPPFVERWGNAVPVKDGHLGDNWAICGSCWIEDVPAHLRPATV